jgi:hypothetical protein
MFHFLSAAGVYHWYLHNGSGQIWYSIDQAEDPLVFCTSGLIETSIDSELFGKAKVYRSALESRCLKMTDWHRYYRSDPTPALRHRWHKLQRPTISPWSSAIYCISSFQI